MNSSESNEVLPGAVGVASSQKPPATPKAVPDGPSLARVAVPSVVLGAVLSAALFTGWNPRHRLAAWASAIVDWWAETLVKEVLFGVALDGIELTLVVLSVVVVVLTVRLWKRSQLTETLDFWSGLAVQLGLLGTVAGAAQSLSGLGSASGNVSVAAGIGAAVYTTLWGGSIMVFAMLASWFGRPAKGSESGS